MNSLRENEKVEPTTAGMIRSNVGGIMESRKLMEMVLNEGLIVEAVLSALKVQRSLFMSNQISFEEWISETREIVDAASVLGVSKEAIERLVDSGLGWKLQGSHERTEVRDDSAN